MKVSTTPALLDSLPQQIFTEFNQLFTSLFSQVTSQQCSFDQAEPEIIQGVMKIARQALAQLLLSYDLEEKHINRPNILGDQWFTYSGKLPRTFHTSAGQIRLERSYYRSHDHKDSFFPLDEQAGLLHHWSLHAVKIATSLTAEMPPNTAANFLSLFGGMTPSKSSLDRLSKQPLFQGNNLTNALIYAETPPKEAAKVAISLDGVHVRMQHLKGKSRFARVGGFGARRNHVYNIEEQNGFSRFKEASCGSVTFFDANGTLLHTRKFASMPVPHKRTLKSQLANYVECLKENRPDLSFIAVADGAKDNWTYFEQTFPDATQVLDFYHATTHLKCAIDEISHSEEESNQRFRHYRHWLRHNPKGIDKLLLILEIALISQPENAILKRELNYFTQNAHRCQYAEVASKNEPIGSGIVESLCKTLVTQRLKQSGMAWLNRGGQCILNMRCWLHSNLQQALWELIKIRQVKDYRRYLTDGN